MCYRTECISDTVLKQNIIFGCINFQITFIYQRKGDNNYVNEQEKLRCNQVCTGNHETDPGHDGKRPSQANQCFRQHQRSQRTRHEVEQRLR